MRSSRLVLLVAVLPLLAACDNSPKPPAAPSQPAAVQTPAAPTPPAPKPPVASTQPPIASRPASNALVAPVLGEWAVDLNDCGEESSTITIADNAFSGAENSCDISGFGDNGDGTLTATLQCGGNTERVLMEPLFAPSGEGIGLTYLDRGSDEFTVLRCN